MKQALRLLLVLLALAGSLTQQAHADGNPCKVGTIKDDGSFTITMPAGEEARMRDVFTVTRGDKTLGDAIVIAIKGRELTLLPKATFKGTAQAGDLATMTRHGKELVDTTAGWVTYHSPDLQYTVSVPEAPSPDKTTTTQGQGLNGSEKMTLFRCTDKVQGMLYLFGVQDFVPDEDDHVGKKERFKRVIIPLEKLFGLDMRWKQGCELNGFPGIDLEYLSKLGLTVRLRVYLVKQRFYILMAFASPRGLSSNALHFLSSLTVTAENPKH